jgi:putative two-component system response regulator
LLSFDKAKSLGLAEFLSAMATSDPAASTAALRRIVDAARSKLSVSSKGEPEWFDRVSELLLGSEDVFAADLRVECLLCCAQWYQKEGKWSLGIATAEKAVSLAEETSNFLLLRRAYSVLGNLHNSTKDYVQATVCYARSVEIARSIGDRVGECASIANLAAARFNSGLIEECRTLNALVIEMAPPLEKEDPRLTQVRAQAHHNIALASLLLGDINIGRNNIEDALEAVPEPENQLDAYQRVIMEYTYVRLLSRASEFESARERAAVAREYAGKANSPPASIQASLAESACDLNEGKWDIALTRLQKLLDQTRINESARRDVLEALVMGHHKAGHNERARELHRDYLNALAQAQRKSAKQQLDALKQSFRMTGKAVRDQDSVLPSEVLEKLRDRNYQLLQDFRKRLEAMAVLAELRDDATGEHAFRVGRLSALFAKELGYSRDEVESVELAARLHDIGKLVVPDVILQKRGKLTEVEVEVMRKHTTEGSNILLDTQNEDFHRAAIIALNHHEWWDGNGYPNRLSGTAIPEIARITALADVFDALSHKRPYKPAWPFERCIATIHMHKGRQFEPRLCDIFLELIQDLNRHHGGDLDAFLGAEARRSPIVNANRLIDRVIQEHRNLLL